MKHISRITVAKAQEQQTDLFAKVTGCIEDFVGAITGAYNSVLAAFDALLACFITPAAS